VKKAIAGLPQPHDVRTREHFEQCDECRAWRHAVEASFELPIPEHRQTHKSHEEFLACDIWQGWERRRDAILEKALGSKAVWI
jgi:predicted anti-sigma-YlaC factor YlaD